MKHWRETARLIGMKVPARTAHAFDYLESVGQRFCIDFGIQNAVEKAQAHWEDNKQKWSVN